MGVTRKRSASEAHWYATALSELPVSTSAQPPSQRLVEEIHDYAYTLLESENTSYAANNNSASSSHKFLSTIMASGTLEDKISALTLLVQESPLHNTKAFETLLGLAKKKSRNQALMAVAAIKDLLGQGDVLPGDRKLRAFTKQPALAKIVEEHHTVWRVGSPLPNGLEKTHLIYWAFEDWLKKQYFELLKILESWCGDEVEYARSRAITYVWELLRDKPEQEENLLRLLVNKLGDKDKKIASRTSYLLLQLENTHPAMKGIIVNAIETESLFRPGQAAHAKYYSIITLNQTILSVKEPEVANKLLDIYFGLFIQFLKPRSHAKAKAQKIQGGGGKGGKMAAKKAKALEQADAADSELNEKMVTAVLTGVNRAFPFAKTDDPTFEQHLDTIFRVTHSSNFNTSIQALMLIQQISATKHFSADRFYRTLYESLLDPRLITSSKQIMYLNLLYKSLKSDVNVKRVQAFVKRLLQTITLHEAPFVCGVLYLVSELEATFPTIRNMIREPEADPEDEEEHFVDAPEDGENPEHSNADRSALWEVLPLLSHFHPSVAIFAEALVNQTTLPPKPDPTKHTLMHFLDRFVYRNAKTKGSTTTRGASIMQPMSGSNAADVLIKDRADPTHRIPLNSDAFWKKKVEDIAADEVFFHDYFTKVNNAKPTKKDKKKQKDAADSDAESDADEDEIWKALVESRPEIEGDDDDDDDDLDMEDLEEGYSDSEGDDGADLGEDMDEDLEDDGFEGLESGDEDAMLGDDEDLPSDFEGLGDDKEEEDTKKEEADNKKKKKKAQAPADIRIDGRLCQVAGDMGLEKKDVITAGFAALVSWLLLTHWVPSFRWIPYAFVAGCLATLIALVLLVLTASKGSNHRYNHATTLVPPAFITPALWNQEKAALKTRSRYDKTPIYPSSAKVDRAIRQVLDNVRKRTAQLDMVELAVARIVPILTNHMRDFYNAERLVRGKNLSRDMTESEELDLAIAAKFRDGKLHPAAALAFSDTKLLQQTHLRRIVAKILPLVMPDYMKSSAAVSALVKEIVACAVLTPVVLMLSDPDFFNQLIENSGRTMLQDRKSVRKLRAALDEHAMLGVFEARSLAKFEKLPQVLIKTLFIFADWKLDDVYWIRRSHTLLRMLSQASLGEVLHSASGLSYFMEYMDRKSRMRLVQFWIVVDGFRNPLEADNDEPEQELPHDTPWSASDRMDLEQMYEAYLTKPELGVPHHDRQASPRAPELRRPAMSSSDLKSFIKPSVIASPVRQSMDGSRPRPLFDDDVEDERMTRSVSALSSMDLENDVDHTVDDSAQVVDAMQAALNQIMDEPDNSSIFSAENTAANNDSPRASLDLTRPTLVQTRSKPSIASLGLVGAPSSKGVFADDLFGEEEKFAEDEKEDSDLADKGLDDDIHEAAPGDLGLTEAIDTLNADIDRLTAQDTILDSLTKKAELTNNAAELRILHVIEVRRQAGDQMPAAVWMVTRRYSEFHELNKRLRARFPAVRNLEFPRRQTLFTQIDEKDFVTRIYNSVTDGMEEFLGNIPVLDQLSVAGQNLISAATAQMSGVPLNPNAPEFSSDPASAAEAEAEINAFEDREAEPWLRGRAVVVVLHQLLGGTIERKVRDAAKGFGQEDSVIRYIDLVKNIMWPEGQMKQGGVPRTAAQKAQSQKEAGLLLATLVPDLAGSVVGRQNAQAASRKVFAMLNNQRLK
ncbi:unnamed protein product [Aureobasidium pullulans]|nr:unnamed protein product [Aureobasidium pullulans]